jgi:hypothetical protein
MKRILLFLFLGVNSLIFSQDSLVWNGNLLQKTDFKATPITEIPYQFSYELKRGYKKQWFDRTYHIHDEVQAVFIGATSWLNPSSGSGNQLALCQLFFDYVEYESRMLQNELIAGGSINTLYPQKRNSIDQRLSALAIDTKYGQDTIQMQFWRREIDQLLYETKRIEIPEYETDNLIISYGWGGSLLGFDQALATYFTRPVLIANTVGFTHKRHHFGMQLAFNGKSSPKKAYATASYSFPDSARFIVNHPHFVYGFDIIQKKRLSITPIVGLSTMRFTRTDLPETDLTRRGPLKGAFALGLSIDMKSKPFFQTNTSVFRYGLQLRSTYSFFNYAPQLSGPVVGISAGLFIYIEAIKSFNK